MPYYSFEDVKSGEVQSLEFAGGDAPGWGETVVRGGRTLRRMVSAPRVLVKAPTAKPPQDEKPRGWKRTQGVAHVSRKLPRHTLADGSPAVKGAAGYTAKGEPIIESQADIDRIERLNPDLVYDPHCLDEAEANAPGD